MTDPVLLSDGLVLAAVEAAKDFDRSVAEQLEYWILLGRCLDGLLGADRAQTLLRNRASKPLSELIESVDTAEGRKRLADYLETLPFPHFFAHPTAADLLVRTEADGQVSIGKFQHREWVIVDSAL